MDELPRGLPIGPPLPATAAAEARAFFGLVLPMVLSRLGLAAMGIVDGLMLARFDAPQLALHGLADALSGRLLEVGMALVMAGLPLAAQALQGGPGQQPRVGQVWRQALMLGLLAGAAGAALALLARPLLAALGQPPALAAGGAPVLAILLLGTPAALLAMACAGVLEALGRAGAVALAVLAANALNGLGNLWLIDGVAGGPPLGAQGVAWSTTLVRSALAIGLVVAVWRLRGCQPQQLRRWPSARDWQAGRAQRDRGLSAAAGVAALALLGLGLPLMAGRLGAGAMATFTALFLLLAPVMVVAWGFVDAAGLRVAAAAGALGAGQAPPQPGALQRQARRLLAATAGPLLALAAAALAVPAAWLAPALPDAALRGQALALLPIGLALVLAEAISFQAAGMLRSLGELRRSLLLQVAGAVLALPLAALAGFGLGPGPATGLAGWPGLGLGGWPGLGLGGLVAGMALATALRAALLAAWLLRRAQALDQRWQRRQAAHSTSAPASPVPSSPAAPAAPAAPTPHAAQPAAHPPSPAHAAPGRGAFPRLRAPAVPDEPRPAHR